jgi:hypothetical protein
MKITTPAGYVVEGTPQELQGLVRELLGDSKAEISEIKLTSGNVDSNKSSLENMAQLIRNVIERDPRLPQGQKDLYNVLFSAGDKGLDYATLAARIGRRVEQLNGLLGALGRRINSTSGVEGKPGVGLLFSLREQAPPKNSWGWAMKPEVRSLLAEQKYSWLKDN